MLLQGLRRNHVELLPDILKRHYPKIETLVTSLFGHRLGHVLLICHLILRRVINNVIVAGMARDPTVYGTRRCCNR